MQWPVSVVDVEKLQEMRSQGISAVLGYLYKSLIDAAASREITQEVETIIRKAVNNAPVDGVLNRSLSELGIAGADQVAELVNQVASQHR